VRVKSRDDNRALKPKRVSLFPKSLLVTRNISRNKIFISRNCRNYRISNNSIVVSRTIEDSELAWYSLLGSRRKGTALRANVTAVRARLPRLFLTDRSSLTHTPSRDPLTNEMYRRDSVAGWPRPARMRLLFLTRHRCATRVSTRSRICTFADSRTVRLSMRACIRWDAKSTSDGNRNHVKAPHHRWLSIKWSRNAPVFIRSRSPCSNRRRVRELPHQRRNYDLCK